MASYCRKFYKKKKQDTNFINISDIIDKIKEALMRKTLGFIIIAFFAFVAILLLRDVKGAFWTYQQTSDEYHQLQFEFSSPTLAQNSYILDRKGKTISEIRSMTNRILLASEEIPQLAKDLFIYTEDRNFYTHKGLDYIGTARAFLINLANADISQGGSTITQQLARGLYLSTDKTYERKIQEMYISSQLEKMLDKDEILTLYINEIYFGNGAYGLEAASRQYFNRSADQLSLAQLAFICAIPNNPTLYNPYINKENTLDRQKRMLEQLVEFHVITKKEYNQAIKEKIVLRKHKTIEKNPEYTTFVHHELKQLVASQMKFEKETTSKEKDALITKEVDTLLAKGIKIYTAYNADIQQTASQAFHAELDSLGIEGAMVVINHENYTIPAIIGGKKVGMFEFNRAYQSVRQPGSAIKPLLVYAPYIDTFGKTPNDMVDSNNVTIGNYSPKNYDGGQYGMVTLKTAMTYSYNTPAVRLLNETGVDTAFSYLKKFRWKHITSKDYYLSSALGAVGVTPLEITNAYTTFSHNGYYKPARAIRKVTDLEGNTLYKWEEKAKQVWSQQTNDYMNEMLQSVVKNGTARLAAGLPFENIGGKTGTTNDYKDLWMVGKGGTYTVGVWIGYDNPESMLGYINSRQPQIHIWRNTLANLAAIET